jgi:hypothetical protein
MQHGHKPNQADSWMGSITMVAIVQELLTFEEFLMFPQLELTTLQIVAMTEG